MTLGSHQQTVGKSQVPDAHALLARKRDHQRAEAMLIALFAGGGAPIQGIFASVEKAQPKAPVSSASQWKE